MKFQVTRRINAPDEELWRIISDVEGIPKYWHGTKKLRVTGKAENIIYADVQFAFPGPFNKGKVRIMINEADKEVIMEYLSGPFTGAHRIKVSKGEVISDWDIEFKPLFKLIESWNENHFKQGTEHALERIEQEAVGSQAKRNQ